MTDQTSAPTDDLWRGYTGSLADVRDPVTEGTANRRPTPPPPPRWGWGRRFQQREWRPTVPEAAEPSSSRPWRPSQASTRRRTQNRVRWESTGSRNTDQAWLELWQQYPEVDGEDVLRCVHCGMVRQSVVLMNYILQKNILWARCTFQTALNASTEAFKSVFALIWRLHARFVHNS